jgi:DNA end-binding protein Ku
MEEAGLSAIAKFVMRDRQYLGALRVRDGILVLEQMYFADEVRSADELKPGEVEVDDRELAMARQLVDAFAGEFEPEKYRDTYRDTLCEIIEAKREGETVRVPDQPEPEQPADLMAALRASVEAARKRRSPLLESADGELDDLSRNELYELAKDRDIPGRSQMSREELVEALRSAA